MEKLLAEFENQHQQTNMALDAYFKERIALHKLSEQIAIATDRERQKMQRTSRRVLQEIKNLKVEKETNERGK
jgi:hypothetical protein